jgi:ribosomal 50S subunit-associated protein YjgA (DUF615 family)
MITVYVILFLLLGLVSYLFYSNNKLNKLIKAQDVAHKKALAEAGNAITDTLKIAFDNIKQHNVKLDKLNNKNTEYQSRFHRLEQHLQQLLAKYNKDNVKELKKQEPENERRNKTS